MNGRRGEGRAGTLARSILRSVGSSSTIRFRVAGTMIGLLSMILPWGSIIVRDSPTHATVSITSVWFVDMITSSALPISIASLIFVAATIGALLDERAVIAQLFALTIIFVTIPDLLEDTAAALRPVLPEGMVSTTIAAGFYLGMFSAIILLVSFVPFKEVGHEVDKGLIGSERARPEENPYHR